MTKKSNAADDTMKRMKWVILVGILFGIVTLDGCITDSGNAVDTDKYIPSFVIAANECQETFLEREEDIGIIEYQIHQDPRDFCTLDKKIVKVADNEDPVVKRMLEGKRLSCAYQKGQFNERWVTTLIYDIENCEGELKESIGQLMVFSS